MCRGLTIANSGRPSLVLRGQGWDQVVEIEPFTGGEFSSDLQEVGMNEVRSADSTQRCDGTSSLSFEAIIQRVQVFQTGEDLRTVGSLQDFLLMPDWK